MRVLLKGIAKVTAKLADGTRETYYYAWRGGPRLVGEPGSPEFVSSYTAAHQSRRLPPAGTLFTLIAEFRSSAEYAGLAPDSKRNYSNYLKLIESDFGDLPIRALTDPACRGVFKEWRDKMASTPRKADYAWTTLARVLAFAKDRGRIPTNPCERGGRLYRANRKDKIWTEDEIAKVLALASSDLAIALILALWTGQRQGDLLKLRWSDYDGRYIRLTQSKTGTAVAIPVSDHLKHALDHAPKKGPFILTNIYGRPWTSDGFRTSWGKLSHKAGITGLRFHDLRGSAVVRLALAEATVPEIATFTGHSLKDVEAILDAHYLGRDVRLAESAAKKRDEKEKRTELAK